MKKPILARRVAKLLIITGYLTNWENPIIKFSEKQSEVQLFYYLMSYSVKELNELLDDLINLLDNSILRVDQRKDESSLKGVKKM